jgi:hypothetical protein
MSKVPAGGPNRRLRNATRFAVPCPTCGALRGEHCTPIRVPYVHVHHRARVIASYASKMRRAYRLLTSNSEGLQHEQRNAA